MAMRGHGESAQVQKQGCGALRNLAVSSDDNRVRIGAEGGIGAVIAAMSHRGVSAGVEARGCG
eukprot:1169890-Rhodomonas_salina.1